MSLFTLQDRSALVVYLRAEAATNAYCARQAEALHYPKTVAIHAAKAEQLEHWAAGVQADIDERRLAGVDAVPSPVGIEGLHDGPVHVARSNTPGDDAINS